MTYGPTHAVAKFVMKGSFYGTAYGVGTVRLPHDATLWANEHLHTVLEKRRRGQLAKTKFMIGKGGE